MKFIFNSDTHNMLSQVKNPLGDLYFHTGDWTLLGQQHEMLKFGTQLRKIKTPTKLIIPGNHDLSTEEDSEFYHADWRKWLKPDNNTLIGLNKEVHLLGLKIYCTSLICPIGNPFRRWAYETSENRQYEIYEKIEGPIDLLISHSPPYGIMDENGYGSKALLDLVLRLKPKIHAFGHAHGGYGKQQIGDTLFINSSICNRQYLPVNKPLIIEY